MSLLRDPLVGFLLAGAVIFALDRWLPENDAANTIEITDTQIQRIRDQWQAQTGRDPGDEELAGLLDAWIREEIYYRQALKMGLEQNDTIIRRRLVQKLTFLTEDLADTAPPGRQALLAFYDSRPQAYTDPERFSFEHRFFSSDRRHDAAADARHALENNDTDGDTFMLQRSYAGLSKREIGDLFGRDFAAALTTLTPSSQWQGPVRSAYGWHLLRITQRDPARLRPFDEVADQVAADLRQQQRRAANDELYQRLRADYDIRMPDNMQ
jgi:peptidyl-prolyl cis-trans isomerase C